MNQDKKSKTEKYIKGLSDDTERHEMESMFLSGDQDFKEMIKNDFNKIISEPVDEDINLDSLLDRIYHTISARDLEKRKSKFQRAKQLYMKIAAVIMLPLLLTSVLIFKARVSEEGKTTGTEFSQATIYAPLGSRVSFNLPDGTTGMLNSGSLIKYSLPFSDNRKVELTGEGWFEVEDDAKHPFVINTPTSTIKVLGTSFNLSAYPDQDYVELVLHKGKVEFFDKTSREKIYILPEERLVSMNGQITKSISDTTRYNGWTEGKLIFKGDSMEEVARRISRWYNVDIELADKQLENYSFRGIFTDDKLEDILSFLAMTSPIEYRIIPRDILPDGTFRKEKVIISLVK
ncbi:MAG TPA: FecR domain-containing protein [Bacteroidales bacterium]|nr:FecR domain-containing protein [Bacteroidales bacterium]